MKDDSFLSRRAVLAALAAGGCAALLPRTALAAPDPSKSPPRRARRVLVLDLTGGVRSSACFLASGAKILNPWGRIDGAPIPLGRLLDDNTDVDKNTAERFAQFAYQLNAGAFSGMKVPPFRETASSFSVVGTWDPERGDHERSARMTAAGTAAASAPGLPVKLFAALSDVYKGKDALETPPFVLGEAPHMAASPGTFSRFAAVDVADPSQLPGSSAKSATNVARVGRDFSPSEAARTRLDDGFLARTGAAGREVVETYALHQRMSRRLGELLASPSMNVGRDADGTAALGKVKVANGKEAPLTNAMLLDALAVGDRLGTGNFGGGARRGGGSTFEMATAIRLLQVGSPAVVVGMSGFDMHSGERTSAPLIYRRLGATWASLHFLLSRIADPAEPSVSMLDRTLVLTTSEFGRDAGQPRTGFNGGEGSDHGSHPACFYLAHAIMGAGIPGGRVVGNVDTDSYDARRAPVRYGPRQLLATALYALGIDPAHPQFGFDGATPIEELWKRA